ncbi:MAG: hypothetical protein LBV16_09120 [Elusimicrobiota bacterium]|jgi:hypothetical protein|nr:hypothetical protein [Elusimicrobiota bacterium]
MKKIALAGAILLAIAFFTDAAFAAKLVEAKTYRETFYIKDVSIVRKALLEACAQRKWEASEIHDGQIEAVLKSSKYSLTVSIVYNNNGYSISYKDSDGLRYNEQKNVIHSSYIRWLENLIRDANANINAMRNSNE